MEFSELTDEQISKLTHEQIEMIENDPDKLAEILGKEAEEPDDEPEQEEEQESAANGAGEEDEQEEEKPVVLTKNGKGVIPYENYQGLRVENATLKEQLQQLQQARTDLEALKKEQAQARSPEGRDEIQKQLTERIETMREDFPDIGSSLDTVNKLITVLSKELSDEKAANKARAEAEETAKQKSIDEQVQEAKENNPHLLHWESNDEDAWREAMMQDQALLNIPKWAKKPYEERFAEVVKRVKAVMPEATEPPTLKQPEEPEKVAEKAKAKLAKATVKKPTTLSDIEGGGQPLSEQELAANLSGHELAKKLMQMPDSKARAMRAELD